ncbi:MAG: ATP-dependent Clp protease ATP-binding subunit [Anaerolineae bacterium]
MTEQLDRFTKRARKVLSMAQEEAQRLNHSYIGTEHLLLGLIRDENGVAVRVFRELGLDPRRVREMVERTVGRGTRPNLSKITLTPHTKQVIELAFEEARRLGHHYISTEHLLLGLMRAGDGMAVNILRSLGVSTESVRSYTSRMLMENPITRTGERRADKQTPLVDQLGIDLTAQARAGKLDPVIGRQREIERVIQILSRRTKNNPALIGEPGVGKTAIVEGLAQRIVAGETPEPLLDKRVLMLDVGSLVAGTMYRGQFEERLKRVIEEIKNSQSILFIDELHMLVGAGAAGSSVDAANILKPALARGELQCIGATTLDEYRRYIEGDVALERRFQPVYVDEPTIEETLEILRGIKRLYEEHHHLYITDEALQTAARLAARYVPDRYLPDKAIDIVDEAASRVRMYKSPLAGDMQEIMAELRAIRTQKEEAFNARRYEEADSLWDREVELQKELEQLRMELDSPKNKPHVTEEDIAEVVSMWTGVPVTQIAGEESERLLQMEKYLHERVVGQEEAISTIARAVRRARSGLKDPKRPIGSFVFLGPTGVGKTLLAKTLAEFMFGSEEALIQLDMSEFMERHNVSRLVGSPPGYVGYEEGGQLTEAIRRRPYSVVLFDEIEKAHPEAFNMLLQIMEDGHLADAKGKRVDFRNTIVIMTSNIGAEMIKRGPRVGFSTPDEEELDEEALYQEMRKKVMGEFERAFRPEFRNRLDGVIVFKSLTREEIKRIVDIELREVRERLGERHMTLEVSEAAKNFLAEKGYNRDFGARPLKRLIQNKVEDPLSEGLLEGRFRPGEAILADLEGEEIVFRVLEKQDVSQGGGETGWMEEAALEALFQ